MLMMKKPKNLEFEPVPPKNVLLASVVHGISCLFVLGLYFDRSYFIEEKFLTDSRWRLNASDAKWRLKFKGA
jgi:hypothetical protein